MSDVFLFWCGVFCFLMTVVGIGFTIIEFRQNVMPDETRSD